MKIGILTFHHVDNFGAAWQCYSLSSQLKHLGHEPFIVNYCPDDALSAYQMPKGRFWLTQRMIGYFKKKFLFNRFRKAHFPPLSEMVTRFSDLQNRPPHADAFIAGSDQIWNHCLFNGDTYDPAYFVAFATSARRISYAASFGEMQPIKLCDELRSSLVKFDYLSVREEAAARTITDSYGLPVRTVCDPVILSENFAKFIQPIRRKREYVFCYNLYNRTILDQQSLGLAKMQDLDVRRINSDWKFWNYPSHSEFGIGPIRWLNLINDARYVVSDSFHSTVFSVILKKKFVTALANKNHSSENRIVAFLAKVGLETRIIDETDTLEDIMRRLESPVDWLAVRRKLDTMREESIHFLDQSLSV
jgi:hypothetical protein